MNKQEFIVDIETHILNELNHYTQKYFEYLSKPKTNNEETDKYIADFVAYCKDKIYYFANELTKKGNKYEY